LEYSIYQVKDNDNIVNVVAIRQSWGIEEEIYKAVENAILLPMMDHLFVMPLNTKGSFIPVSPSIVMDGVYYAMGESCSRCVMRTQKVTFGECPTCEFSPVGKRKDFNVKALEKLLKENQAEPVDMLALMEKKNIYEVYHLYHFKNFYSEELPLRLDEFLTFIDKFNVETLFRNDQEIFFEKNEAIYQVNLHTEFIDDKIHKRGEAELRAIYEETKDKIKVLTKKKDFLQRILKNIF
jgi:hypothetical protein